MVQQTKLLQVLRWRTRKYRSLRVRNSANVASPYAAAGTHRQARARNSTRQPCDTTHLLHALFQDAVDSVLVLMQQRRDVVHVQTRGALVHARHTAGEQRAQASKGRCHRLRTRVCGACSQMTNASFAM